MAKKKDLNNDFNIYLKFTLVSDMTYDKQKAFVVKTMDELFAESCEIENEDEDFGQAERELVYKIQKPVMVDNKAYKNFFLALQEVFNDCYRFLPSFTQGSEV